MSLGVAVAAAGVAARGAGAKVEPPEAAGAEGPL